MKLNAMDDYWKPMVKMRFHTGWLQNVFIRFVSIGMRLQIYNAQVSSPIHPDLTDILSAILFIDHRLSVRELSLEICLSDETVGHIIFH